MLSGSDTARWPPITSGQQFWTFVEDRPQLVVFFTAPWCFRCRQVEPKFSGFPADFPDVTFASADLDTVSDLGDQLDVSTLPTIVLYRAGVEVCRLEGVPQQRPTRALAAALWTHFPAA